MQQGVCAIPHRRTGTSCFNGKFSFSLLTLLDMSRCTWWQSCWLVRELQLGLWSSCYSENSDGLSVADLWVVIPARNGCMQNALVLRIETSQTFMFARFVNKLLEEEEVVQYVLQDRRLHFVRVLWHINHRLDGGDERSWHLSPFYKHTIWCWA